MSKIELNKFRVTSVVLIILMLILIRDAFFGEDVTEIECSQNKKDEAIKKIVSAADRPLSAKMLQSCKSGVMTGCIAGSMSGGLTGAISSAAIFGITNPIVTYITETNELKSIKLKKK